ncbi:MAG: hypothetical protein FWG61_08015 [Firmicutes bacterium]|nr:hypothetical protein [Bacillota bacterium]
MLSRQKSLCCKIKCVVEANNFVAYAEPNLVAVASSINNTPGLNNLWGMAQIQADLAWDIFM